jgi:hypothetical protein
MIPAPFESAAGRAPGNISNIKTNRRASRQDRTISDIGIPFANFWAVLPDPGLPRASRPYNRLPARAALVLKGPARPFFAIARAALVAAFGGLK